jgi:hypothetical protein
MVINSKKGQILLTNSRYMAEHENGVNAAVVTMTYTIDVWVINVCVCAHAQARTHGGMCGKLG